MFNDEKRDCDELIRTARRHFERSDFNKAMTKLEPFLRKRNVHVHADLMLGLPGEGFDTALQSLSDVLGLAPQTVQVTSLKVLPGTPLRQKADELGISFHSEPPYEVAHTAELGAEELERLLRIGRLVHLYYNSAATQGAVGATVRLFDQRDHLLGLRELGVAQNMGSQAPLSALFGVPRGKYKVTICMSDGGFGQRVVDVSDKGAAIEVGVEGK